MCALVSGCNGRENVSQATLIVEKPFDSLPDRIDSRIVSARLKGFQRDG